MEAATGVSLFPLAMPQASAAFIGIDELWKLVTAVPHPGQAPIIEDQLLAASMRPSAGVEKLNYRLAQKVWALLSAIVPSVLGLAVTTSPLRVFLILGGIAAGFVVYHILDKSTKVKALVQRKSDTHQIYAQAAKEYASRAGPQSFDRKRAELEDLRRSLEALPNDRLTKLNELRARLRESQLEQFLDGYEIPAKGISGIGAARKATLESYGIETAADVTRHNLVKVPGIGPTRQAALERWRRSIEAKFRFDPSRGIDPREQAKVEQEILIARQNLVAQLQKGLLELKQISTQVAWARTNLKGKVQEAYREYMQASVDGKALGL